MKLTDVLQLNCVKVPLQATEKYQAITELIDLLDEAQKFSDYDTALRAVMQREAVRSTGVGQGFAVPHGKCAAVDRLVIAMGKTTEPIEFESIDKQPVNLIVLLVSPLDQTGPHIQALANISRFMTTSGIRQHIDDCLEPDQLYKLIKQHEQSS